MDKKRIVKGLMFYLLSALYLFVGFGSIYGLVVDEIILFQLSITGGSKNALCLTGLLLVGLISAYPIVSAVHNALNNTNNINDNRNEY